VTSQVPPEADQEREESAGSHPSDSETEDYNVGLGLLDESMGPSSALAHLYRGEVHRMKLWRERLDRTTNWAVLLLAAIVTWAFSNPSNPHYVLLIGNLAVGLFLVVEARRYRAYDMWRSRVRTLQRNVFAPGLDPTQPPDPSWRARLAADYRNPTLKITAEEGIAHRLRRVYLPLFALLDAAWVLRVTSFGAEQWPASAAIGPIPGVLVTLGLAAVLGASVFVAVRSRIWRAHDELRTEDIRSPHE
jgi:uncharacterized membrane protein